MVQRSLGIRGVKTAKHRVHREGEVRREGEHIRREARLQQPCKTLVGQAPLGHLSAGSGFGAKPPDSEEAVDMGKAGLHPRGWITRRTIRTESWTEYKVGAHYQPQ